MQKLLKGEVATRRRKNVVQARSFAEMHKRILRKHGYPPDKQEKAMLTLLEQAALLSAEWAAI